MKFTEDRIRGLLYLALTVGIFFFIRTYCQYDYAYAEQLRLFLFSPDYIQSLLFTAGKPATLLADYLTQYYISPNLAAAINAGMFLLAVLLVDRIVTRAFPNWLAPFVAVSYGIYLLVQETDLNHRMESTLATLLLLGFMVAILYIRHKVVATVIAALAVGVLAYFSGSYLPMLVASALCLLYNFWGAKINLHKYRISKPTTRHLFLGAGCVAALWLGLQYFVQHHYPQSTRLKCLETLRWNKNWDGILSLPYMQVCPTPLYAAYQNLALAQKNCLGEQWDKVPQMGVEGLWYDNHGLQNEMMLLSDVFFIQGNVAQAQMQAFNALAYAQRVSHPHLLIRLIETNLILGAYPVAEKYIQILEKTLNYAELATSYRKFLNHPEVLAQDPVLGPIQQVAQTQSGISSDIVTDLQKIVEANPDYQPARDYLNCYQKLSLNQKAE